MEKQKCILSAEDMRVLDAEELAQASGGAVAFKYKFSDDYFPLGRPAFDRLLQNELQGQVLGQVNAVRIIG